jgi:hypothetical protein
MTSPDEGIRAQLRNIEQGSGTPITTWLERIDRSGLSKHTDVVAMLKRDYGISHGSAHRLSLVARARADEHPAATPATITHALYPGNKAALVPIHQRLLEIVATLGDDVQQAPKKGYVSLRRRRQFAMIKPGAKEVNLGLSLGDVATGERLESAATFNALFSHRVRLRAADEVDQELTEWLRLAYERAA